MTAPAKPPSASCSTSTACSTSATSRSRAPHETLAELREPSAGVRLVTNTTSRSRRDVARAPATSSASRSPHEEVLTPAAMAVRHCEEHGYESVAMLVSEKLREDLAALRAAEAAASARTRWSSATSATASTAEVLNDAFRLADGRRRAGSAAAQPLLAAQATAWRSTSAPTPRRSSTRAVARRSSSASPRRPSSMPRSTTWDSSRR